MRLADALAFINKPDGFRVEFERQKNGMMESDFFPARDEPPIATEEEAWNLARRFAIKGLNKGIVNVCVLSTDYMRVPDCAIKVLNLYP